MIFSVAATIILGILAIYILVKRNYSLLMNPCFIFVLEWLIIMTLSGLRLFGLYETSTKSYIIISIGIASFILGYLLLNKLLKHRKKEKIQSSYTVRYRILYALGLLCAGYYLLFAIESIQKIILSGGSFNDIRIMAQTSGGTSALINFFSNFIITPATYTLEIITAADLFRGKKDKKLLSLTLSVLILKTIADGGRSFILNFVLYIFIAYIMSKKHNKRTKENLKNKKTMFRRMLPLVIILIAFFAIVTIQRSPSGVFRITYLYFAMPPVMLDWWTNVTSNPEGTWFGLVCLNGLLFAIGYFIKNIFCFSKYPAFIQKPYDLIAKTDSYWVPINDNGTKANAYVSIFWFFYADYGYLGVSIGCMIYGLIVRKIHDYEKRAKDVRSLSIYLLILWTILYSFVRFQFAKSSAVILVLMVLFMFKKQQYSSNTEQG